MIHKILKLLKRHGGRDIIVIKRKNLSLSLKIILLLISSGVLSILCYGVCRYYVTDFYDLMRTMTHKTFNYDQYFDDFKEKVKDINIYSEDKNEKKKLKQLVKDHDKYTSVFLYDHETGEYMIGDFGNILDEQINTFPLLSIMQSDFEQYSYNMFQMSVVEFQDGFVDVYVTDMYDLKYSKYYFYFTLIACLLVFFLPTFIFIRRKVKYINCLKNEILNMSQGDLQHPITIKSYDELAILAREMDHLRETLEQNIQNEKEIKKTNRELITSLSHDLRTPLTSLMGYLDILRLHRYQNDEQMQQYLFNCIDKVNQIKDLSNKTFEYALVFENDFQIEQQNISSLEVIQYLENNLEYLELEGFIVHRLIEHRQVRLSVDLSMMKRLINNVCSNIYKYALKEKPVFVNVEMKQNQIKIILSNEKRKNIELIESNQIGLKSVERIVKLHQGNIFIQNLENIFTIVIQIPYL